MGTLKSFPCLIDVKLSSNLINYEQLVQVIRAL